MVEVYRWCQTNERHHFIVVLRSEGGRDEEASGAHGVPDVQQARLPCDGQHSVYQNWYVVFTVLMEAKTMS